MKNTKKDKIFKTLPHYEKGFFRTASPEQAEIYRIKSGQIKARILSGKEDIVDILIDEEGKLKKEELKVLLTPGGVKPTPNEKYAAEYKAWELIRYCLIDSKPL